MYSIFVFIDTVGPDLRESHKERREAGPFETIGEAIHTAWARGYSSESTGEESGFFGDYVFTTWSHGIEITEWEPNDAGELRPVPGAIVKWTGIPEKDDCIPNDAGEYVFEYLEEWEE